MNRARLSHDPLKEVDSDIPQCYRDIIGGMINRCTSYDEEADLYLFDRELASERYGERFANMVNWHDQLVTDDERG
jgi:hypothetical protein